MLVSLGIFNEQNMEYDVVRRIFKFTRVRMIQHFKNEIPSYWQNELLQKKKKNQILNFPPNGKMGTF